VAQYIAALRSHKLELKHFSETRSHVGDLSRRQKHDQGGEDKDSVTTFPDGPSARDVTDVTSNRQTHNQQKEHAKETEEKENTALITTGRKHTWNYLEEHVQRQGICQQNRSNIHPKEPSLQSITSETDAKPFKITKPPLFKSHGSVFAITNNDCTKAAILLPCKETLTLKPP
jgi:hypothetical protein